MLFLLGMFQMTVFFSLVSASDLRSESESNCMNQSAAIPTGSMGKWWKIFVHIGILLPL